MEQMDEVVEAMTEHRLQGIKSYLDWLETTTLHDTYDFSVALSDTKQNALELVEEVERLRKIEAGVRKMIEDRKNVVELVRGEADEDEALGLVRTAGFHRDNAERLMSDIWPLEALLDN
jgi:hypothetical protein